MTGAIVQTAKLAQVVGYALLFGVGVSAVFGLGVSGVAGLLEALRDRRTGAVIGWGALTALCAATALGSITLGIVVMARK